MITEDTPKAVSLLSPATTGGPRFRELDSIRGIAALIVVFHHFRTMWFFQEVLPLNLRSVLLYPLSAGRESVILFFLLSGFVLSIPYLRGNSQPYPLFLLRRILRIYCPYLFGLALAVAGNAVWHGSLGLGPWADQTWLTPVSWLAVIENILMVGISPMLHFNPAFWSLVIEMRVSIVFPFLFLMVRKMSTWMALLLAAGCSLVLEVTDRLDGEVFRWLSTLEYVAVFIVGILLAMHWNRIGPGYRSLSLRARWAVAGGSFLLFDFSHLLLAVAPERWKLQIWYVQDWPVTLGAAGLMIIGLESRTARAFLTRAIPRFLGRISYSLYLVHGTVLFATAYLLAHRVSRPVAFAVYLPLALLISTAFCFWIEEPFLRLGRYVSRSSHSA
jgi:peptidoglycan/LPS O-acetylase OafA/YrhL